MTIGGADRLLQEIRQELAPMDGRNHFRRVGGRGERSPGSASPPWPARSCSSSRAIGAAWPSWRKSWIGQRWVSRSLGTQDLEGEGKFFNSASTPLHDGCWHP